MNENTTQYGSNGRDNFSLTPIQLPSPKKKKRKILRSMACLICCSLISGMVGAGCMMLLSNAAETGMANVEGIDEVTATTILEGQRSSSVLNVAYINTEEEMTTAEIYAVNVNSTVGITTSVTTNYFGHYTTSAASGSGFILTADGYIVTNYHVIEEASSITVTTYDGESYDATLVGYDESNDLAVLKVDATDLVPVILGDSNNLNVGDEVLAIGNPLGELTFSLTTGVISALDREVTLSSSITMDLIQTDCAINSGNSGGALFNTYGEVIGITNAKYSSSSSSDASIDNIGFAIPISDVKDIVESIIEKGYISQPYIGVSIGDVSSETQSFGLPSGAVVKSVAQNSPAEIAGLQINDIITAVNGKDLESSNDLKNIISDSEVGDNIILTVYRQGKTLEISVTVAEQQQAALQETMESTAQNPNSQRGSGTNGMPRK